MWEPNAIDNNSTMTGDGLNSTQKNDDFEDGLWHLVYNFSKY